MFHLHKKENNEKVSITEIVETKKKRERIPLTKEQKKKRRNKILIGTVAIVVVAAVVLPKVFAPEVLPTVNVVQVATGDVVQMIEGSGTVKSEEVKTYFSPVSATVENCQLKVGDLVETGDLLLTFDEKELDQLYKQAGLTGSVANYGYQDAINKNQETESEYQRSSQALKEIRKDLEAEKDENEHVQDRIVEYTGKQSDVALRISQYQAVAADALLKIEDATREKQEALALKIQLEQQLATQGGGTQGGTGSEPQTTSNGTKEQATEETISGGTSGQTSNEIATAEGETTPEPGTGTGTPSSDIQTQIDAAEVRIAAAEQTIAAQQPVRDQALAEIEKLQKEQKSIDEKLNGYEDRLKASNEQLQELQSSQAKEESIKDSSKASILSTAAKQQLAANNSLSSLEVLMTKEDITEGKKGIKAEFPGVVMEVSTVSGGPAAKGVSLFTVASNEKVVVDMSVTRYDLEKLEVGQNAKITLAGKNYEGTVSRLSRLAAENAKGTPVVSAEIQIENPDDSIYLGLEAKVKVEGHKAENVLIVPVEAVNTGKDGSFCYVVENGVVVKREVETGLSSASLIEVKSGLKAGDQVIKIGTELLEEGMKVNTVEE